MKEEKLKAKRIFSILLLCTAMLFCSNVSCWADEETLKNDVLSNNPSFDFIGYGKRVDTGVALRKSRNVLLYWFVDRDSIDSRKSEDGAKYWIVHIYCFFNMPTFVWKFPGTILGHYEETVNKVPLSICGGHEGKHSKLMGWWLVALNKKQRQIQFLEGTSLKDNGFVYQCNYEKQTQEDVESLISKGFDKYDRSFSSDRWEEITDENMNTLYDYVKEHGGKDIDIPEGIVWGAIGFVAIGLIVFGIFKLQSLFRRSVCNQESQLSHNMSINANAKFCRKCGAKASGNAQFCGKCGERF